jgi:hypothetical protein
MGLGLCRMLEVGRRRLRYKVRWKIGSVVRFCPGLNGTAPAGCGVGGNSGLCVELVVLVGGCGTMIVKGATARGLDRWESKGV